MAAISLALFNAATANDATAAHDVQPHHRTSASAEIVQDHHHSAGSWMLSYRHMSMSMEGLVKGSDSITSEQATGEVLALPSGLARVRVVPQKMTSDMHMLGAMYAVNDRVTLMAMVNYLEKHMELTTYAGMMGSNELGDFSTSSSGVGDSKIAVLWGLHQDPTHKVHFNLGLSLPTGSIDETGVALTPMGMNMKVRLPYGMQTGSGSWGVEPGLTYGGYSGELSWGAHYRAKLQLDDNDAGYRFGDLQQVAAWGSIKPLEWLSSSLRLTYTREGDIEGHDPAIAAPVTTADPNNYGGERLNLGVGISLMGNTHFLHGHRLEIEYEAPLYQDLNGLQMEMQPMIGLSYQYAF